VDYLFSSGADHVGGVMRATGRTYLQQAIALAMSSPFGVGTARFRYTRREHDIDTVPFGAFRRETLLRLGGFDERFVIGQDSEFDHRLILRGGRVRVTPEIHTDYYCRDSFKGLALQYFRYGKAKAKILHKHRSLPSPRAAMPAAFVGLVVILLAMAPFSGAARRGLWTLLAAYLTGCLGAGMFIAAKGGWRYLPALPPILATLHWSHGLGFLSALPIVREPRPENPLQGSLEVPRAASRTSDAPVSLDVGAAS
jgi:GT2 family glycosyltransferase